MNDKENLENHVIHFVEGEEAPVRRSIDEPRLKRRGRPPHNPSEPVRSSKKLNKKPQRDIQRNVLANKGNSDLAPWSQNAFCLPTEAHERFERAGYVTLFCPLDDMSLRSRELEGWVPVTIEEVPEWMVSSIPSLGYSQDIYRKYVVCIDQILMKMEKERYEQLKSYIQKERDYTQNIINKAKQNSNINPLMLSPTHALNISKNRS